MTMANNKRPQRAKGMGNREWWDANEERKRSSVASPFRNKSKYRRRKSGAARWGEDD